MGHPSLFYLMRSCQYDYHGNTGISKGICLYTATVPPVIARRSASKKNESGNISFACAQNLYDYSETVAVTAGGGPINKLPDVNGDCRQVMKSRC